MLALRFLVHDPRIGEIAAGNLLLLHSIAHIIQPCRPAEFAVPVGVMQSEKQLRRAVTEHIAPRSVEVGLELEHMPPERLGQSDAATARQFMITIPIDTPVIVDGLHLQYVQKIASAQLDIEIEAAQIGEIVADTHAERSVVVMLPVVGDLRKGIIGRRTVAPVSGAPCLRPIESVIMVKAVRQIEFSLQQPAAEVFARRSAQTALYLILDTITKIMAPILCFTGDEIWLAMPHKEGDDTRNVLFNDMNGVFADYALSADEMAKWEKIITVRTTVNGALETARAEKKIGKSLEADVALTVPAEDAFLAEMDGAALADLLIVSKVEVTVGGELAVSVSEAAGTKCPRCWKHSTQADENGLCPRCASVIAKCADFGEV